MRIEMYKKCMNYVPKYSIIHTDSDKFMHSQGFDNRTNLENIKTAGRAINDEICHGIVEQTSA